MAKYSWLAGSTDRTILIFVQDSSSTTGEGLASLAAADFTGRYIRVETDNDVTIATLTLSDLSALTDAHSDGGIFPVDNTNSPGWYRLDIPDAVIASGAWTAGISLIDSGANDIAQVAIEIQLDPAPVNVTQLVGDAQSATDLKDFADAGYDPSSNKVQGVVLVDTCTTNSDMRGTDSAYTGTPPTAGAIADAVWDEATSGHTTSGTFGEQVKTDIDAILVDTAEIGAAGDGLTALASAANLSTLTGYVDTEVAAIKAKTDNLPASPAATGDIPAASAIADAVWDEAISGHSAGGSTGEALSAAGGAGNPWITALPGSYTSGQAGYILGTFLDATVSSRATIAGMAIGTGGGVAGQTTLTGVSTQITTLSGKVDTIDGIVDDILADTGTDGVKLDLTQAVPTSNTAQTVGDTLNAARAQGFGKWVKSGTTLTLYANDGTTTVKSFTLDDADEPTSRTPA